MFVNETMADNGPPNSPVTLVLPAALAVGTVAFDLDVGFLSVLLAVVLRLACRSHGDAVGTISWSTVLMI